MLIQLLADACEHTFTDVTAWLAAQGVCAFKVTLPEGAPGLVVPEVVSDEMQEKLLSWEGIQACLHSASPAILSSREFQSENTVIDVGGLRIGETFCMMAGLDSIEDRETTLRMAEKMADSGVKIFRASAYKPRTGPYSFQGHGEESLSILEEVKQQFQLAVITEVLEAAALPAVLDVADIVQVGTRNMTNSAFLKHLGRIDRPVLLKRGMASTLEEYLLAAEYILQNGNYRVILCERGIRSFVDHCRNVLDIAAIPALIARTHLPVIVDPSHAAGTSDWVVPLARAAIAAGAGGLLVEVHDQPHRALCDGQQAIHPDEICKLLQFAARIENS